MLKHLMITWGSHPPDSAPRCEEFTHDEADSPYQFVNCEACLHQIIIDLHKKVEKQAQTIADWESIFENSKYDWKAQGLPPTHDLPSTYYNGE